LQSFYQFFQSFELRTTGKWLLLSAFVGIVAGIGAIAFQLLGQLVQHVSLVEFAGYKPPEAAGEHAFFAAGALEFWPWMIVLVMACGGIVSGWLVYTFAPEAEGHGTDAAIDAFHNKRGDIPLKTPIIKLLASAITIGTGGSAGREGPIAQIGSGFGSFLARQLGLSARDRRIMLAAGMGAGVGAIFRAPLAGALFAGEILYRDADLESDVIVPSAVSSTVAYSVYSWSLPADMRFAPLFGTSLGFGTHSVGELLPYLLLAVVLTLVGVAYINVFRVGHGLFKRVPLPRHLRPAIGAAAAGLIGVGLFIFLGSRMAGGEHLLSVLGTGYGTLQAALTEGSPLGVELLLTVALVKILTTTLTIASGGSGGVFGPSMVIGGCLGAAAGKTFHAWWPQLVPQPGAFAIVGMAGFFAGCARAPFSTILMVTEMTGSYRLLLPTLWVAALCFLLCRGWTLYEKQVPTRLDSPAHRGDFIVDVLEGIRVGDVYSRDRKLLLVPERASLDEIVHMLAKTPQRYFPVVDEAERMVGIISAEDVRSYLYDDTLWKVANAGDVMETNLVTVTPEDDLNSALRRFTAMNLDELPVVDPSEPHRLLGMLRHRESIAAYNRRLMEHKQGEG
jgi:CIC family chloride channel protein